jgi:leukotriene-A4 hydrolase
MEALYGTQARAAQEAACPGTTWRRRGLRELGGDAPAPPPRPDRDPTAASGIVYDKGATFLRTIERIVGRERFDAYLRSYFDRHAFQPMTSARFLADLRANLVKGDRRSSSG